MKTDLPVSVSIATPGTVTPAKPATPKAAKPAKAKAKAKPAAKAKAKPAKTSCNALNVGFSACKCGGPLCGANVTS